jgi:hypothetical protein
VSLRNPTIRDVVGAVGAVALAAGIVAAFAPDTLPGALLAVVDEVEAAVEPWVVVLVLSLVVFAYALYRFRRSDDGTVERLVPEGGGERSIPDVDGAVVDFDPDRPGRAFDHAMARTVAQLEADPNADAWEADRVRAELETAVVTVLTGRGREASAVGVAVEDGSWTDDRVAAAFLGGADAPGMKLRRRVYAWLFPARAFRGRVERVVDEIEAVRSDGGRGGESGADASADDGREVGRAGPGTAAADGEGVGS